MVRYHQVAGPKAMASQQYCQTASVGVGRRYIMTILVTGGLGLIGHQVVSKLENLGYDVVIVDIKTNYGIIPQVEIDYLISERLKFINTLKIFSVDIADAFSIDWIFKKYIPTAIIHLASFPRQKVVNSNPANGARVMCEGLINLLECCIKYKCNRFLYTSSSMVYGDFKDNVTENSVCNPQGQYGIMKLAGEWLIKDYQRKGIDYTIFRPSAVYGPLDVEDRVISKFLISAMRSGKLKVNGIHETLDFTYVDDAANGIVQAFSSKNTKNKTYNITKSHSKTLLSAAELAIKLAGNGFIEIRDKDQDFPSRGALDITAAKRDFNFDPKIDIDEGFEIYYNWIKNSSYWQKNL
jgi:nucleoside-diphosphate-sugar epimerase